MLDERDPILEQSDPQTAAQNPAPQISNTPQIPTPSVFAAPEARTPVEPQPTFTAPEARIPVEPQPTFTAPEPRIPVEPQPTFTAPEARIPVEPQPTFTAPEPRIPVEPQPTFTAPDACTAGNAPTEAPTYRGNAAGSAPYHSYYYNYQTQPQYQPVQPQYQPVQQPKPPRPPKKKAKSGHLGWKVAVIAVCCAFLGSVVGGGLMGGIVYSYYRDTEKAEVPQKDLETPTTAEPSKEPAVQTSANQTLLTPALIYERNVDSVVGILNETTSYSVFGPTAATGSGSGFIISSDGEILTNYHVVEGAQKLTVSLSDGSEYDAVVLGYEAESDIALLKIDAENLQAVTLGDSDSLRVGDEIAAIGNPLGELTYTMTVGYVSALDRSVSTDGDPISMMQIDAAINSGNSGGPLFDMKGNVVGITSAKYSGSTNSGATIEGIGFAIPINDVLKILDDLRENGAVLNRAYIGITVTNGGSDGEPNGAKVYSLTKTGCGYAAGLREGDIITAIDEKSVDGSSALISALRDYRAGDTATLTVSRGGETLDLSITFDAKPSSDTSTDTEPESEEPTQESYNWSFPWDIFP